MEIDFALPAWLLWTLAAAVGVPLYAVVGAATAGLVHRLEGSGGGVDSSFVIPGALWPIMLPFILVVVVAIFVSATFSPVTKRVALFVANVGTRKKG